MSQLSPTPGQPNAWLAVCALIVQQQLPGNNLMVCTDTETGELDHVQVRVADIGELSRWSYVLESGIVRHQHGDSVWSTTSGEVAVHRVEVGTMHTSVES